MLDFFQPQKGGHYLGTDRIEHRQKPTVKSQNNPDWARKNRNNAWLLSAEDIYWLCLSESSTDRSRLHVYCQTNRIILYSCLSDPCQDTLIDKPPDSHVSIPQTWNNAAQCQRIEYDTFWHSCFSISTHSLCMYTRFQVSGRHTFWSYKSVANRS